MRVARGVPLAGRLPTVRTATPRAGSSFGDPKTYRSVQAVFSPDLEPAFRWLSALALLAIGGVALAVYSFGLRRFRLRPVGQLLGPTLALFGTAGAILVGWDISRSPTVAVLDDYAIFGADTVRATELRRAFLEPVTATRLGGQGEVAELAVVEFDDGRRLVFGPDEYDTRGLVEALRVMGGSE